MPCFIFISGFLAKRMNVGGKLRIEKIITIIFMYILFKGGYVLLGYVFNKKIKLNLFVGTSAPWYLLALSIWYLFVPFLERIKPKYLITASFIIGIWVGNLKCVNDVFSLSRVFVFFPFFIIGFCLTEQALQEFLDKKLRIYALIFMILTLSFFLINGSSLKPVISIIYASKPYTSSLRDLAPYGMLVRAIWYLLASILSISFLLLVPRCKFFFSKYGARTMQIYMTHIWFRNALLYAGFFTALKESPDYLSYMVFFGSIILTFILANKYFTKVFSIIQNIIHKMVSKILVIDYVTSKFPRQTLILFIKTLLDSIISSKLSIFYAYGNIHFP